MSDAKVGEDRLWDWLKTAEKNFGRELHMERIENLVGVGAADVSGTWLHGYFDIELKTTARPARAGTQVLNRNDEYIRPAQKIWHRRRWLAGGNNFVLLQVGSRTGALRYLIRGDQIDEIEGRTETQLSAMSVLRKEALPSEVIERAVTYRSTCIC